MDTLRAASHAAYWRDTYAAVEDLAIRAAAAMPGLHRTPALLFAMLNLAHDRCLSYGRIEEHIYHLTSERPTKDAVVTAARRLRRALREHPEFSERVALRTIKGMGYSLKWADARARALHDRHKPLNPHRPSNGCFTAESERNHRPDGDS